MSRSPSDKGSPARRFRPIATARSNRPRFSRLLALDPEPDALVHSLVEPRHRSHHRRSHLEQVARQRVGALGEIDFGAERDREHQPGGMLVRMRQRQEAEEYLVVEAKGLKQAVGAAAIADDVAMGLQDPFR